MRQHLPDNSVDTRDRTNRANCADSIGRQHLGSRVALVHLLQSPFDGFGRCQTYLTLSLKGGGTSDAPDHSPPCNSLVMHLLRPS
ncbi:MAG: hypothetical protein KDA93_08560 [Planctomycetaceae bacterium]|nr:hypothetical protein [Planctomycetaceae bacterium]